MIESTPATERLAWLLAGLDGRWPEDDGETAAFAAEVPPGRFVAVMRERAAALAPIRVVGLDVDEGGATARFAGRDHQPWVARVEVEPDPPHRIALAYASPSVPDWLAPPLPMQFTDETRPPAAEGQFFLAMAGVPGSGKSAVAEAVGAELGVTVIALDWLLGALSLFGMRHRPDLMDIGYELMITLAHRELTAGRSVILDSPGEEVTQRARWASLAADVRFVPVVCVCSDPDLHQQRVTTRQRGIPGWADAGEWDDVQTRLARFAPWPSATIIDTAAPLPACTAEVLELLS